MSYQTLSANRLLEDILLKLEDELVGSFIKQYRSNGTFYAACAVTHSGPATDYEPRRFFIEVDQETDNRKAQEIRVSLPSDDDSKEWSLELQVTTPTLHVRNDMASADAVTAFLSLLLSTVPEYL